MYQAQAMNLKLYGEGNPEANFWADKVAEYFKRDSVLCAAYNHDFANGKWNGMMTQKHIGYRSWNDDFGPRDIMPRVRRLDAKTEGNVFADRYSRIGAHFERYFTPTIHQTRRRRGVDLLFQHHF